MGNEYPSITVDEEIVLQPDFLVDDHELFELIQGNLQHNARWLAWSTPSYSFENFNAFRSEQRADWDSGKGRSFAIKYASRLVGSVGLYRLSAPTRDPGIGYWLDQDHQGRGIMTRSAAALVDLAFEQFGANLVHITAATENLRSRAIAERLGMRLDGILRQRTVNAAGEFLDAAYYSITRDEWAARSPSR